MPLSHLSHVHWHFAAAHPNVGWPDVLCFGGAAAMIWAGFDLGAGSLLTWVVLASGPTPPGPFDFSGLAGTIVALTGLAGVVTGYMVNNRKLRIEEMKLDIEAIKGQLDDANADRAALRDQLERTRDNFHRTANVVNELDLERKVRLMTPDPDRSGPQKVIVVNDPGHPVPTDPVLHPPGGQSDA